MLPLAVLTCGLLLTLALGHAHRRWEAHGVIAQTLAHTPTSELERLAIHLEGALGQAGIPASSWDILLQLQAPEKDRAGRARVVVLLRDSLLFVPLPYRVEEGLTIPADADLDTQAMQQAGWQIRTPPSEHQLGQ